MGPLDPVTRGWASGASRALAELERLRAEFGASAAARKLELLAVLERMTLPRAADVARLHEVLLFLRAYPDDAPVLAVVARMLDGFERRRDLRRHRRALESSGIAGTAIRFRFFAPTALWLAARWPDRLTMDWRGLDETERLEALLPLLAHPAELPALDEVALDLRGWIRRMKSSAETDAAFLARRFADLPMSEEAREILWDQIDAPLVLAPGPGTPARTRALVRHAPVEFQRAPLQRGRSDLRSEMRRPPRAVIDQGPRAGARFVDLSRVSMVTRQRDLDAFAYGDPRDVRILDMGGGLAFAAIGVRPERRLLLESVYGFLTLRNGVPIGYVLASALFGSAEIAYNVFETFRGAEAAAVYGRVVAMLHHLFGADAFTIVPYQLGADNEEALSSGAWWFYRKLGFAPDDPVTRRLVRREEARLRSRTRARSGRGMLARLARASVFIELGRRRKDVIGRLELSTVGLHVMQFLARNFGSDRARAEIDCTREAARLLGAHSFAGWSADERRAFTRWAPLVLTLPGIAGWERAERRALVEVVRAKGGRRESEFVRRFDAHRRLRQSIVRMAQREPAAGEAR